jgi:hypothetical protein
MRQAACAPGLCWPFCWPPTVCWPAGFRRGPASGTCGRQRWCTGDVWCAPHQTARRAGLADPCPCAVLCLEKGGGCVTTDTATTVCEVTFDTCSTRLSLSHLLLCSVLLSWLSDSEHPPLRIPLPIQHCDHGDCVRVIRAATKTKGEWVEWRRKRWQGWAQVRAREAAVTRV